jgi:hypothetical protein
MSAMRSIATCVVLEEPVFGTDSRIAGNLVKRTLIEF